MAKNILKEAIADAKAVREVALANAKAALEEAFTPKLQSMLSAKLSETLNEEEEEIEENYTENEETVDEITGMENEGEGLDEEIDLEEILNELELDEAEEAEGETVDEGEQADGDETVDEAKDEVEETMDEAEDKEEVEEAVGYPNHKADQVQKVKADATDVNQGLNEGGEFDLDALLEEINNLDENEDEVNEVEEKVEESWFTTGKHAPDKSGSNFLYSLLPKSAASKFKSPTKDLVGSNAVGSFDEFKAAAAKKGMKGDFENWETYFTEAEESMYETLEKELDETKAALEVKTSELNEVNLLNSKLLYVNRIFKANNLDEAQKLRVVETLDNASNIKEAKLIYETIKDTFNVAKSKKASVKSKTKSLKEGLGMASKAAGTSTAPKKEVISESTDMISRFQKLANIKINQ